VQAVLQARAEDSSQGDRPAMRRVEVPCGRGHQLFYPKPIRKPCVFGGVCECGIAFLVSVDREGARVRWSGSDRRVLEILDALEAEGWKAVTFEDRGGLFVSQTAPSAKAFSELKFSGSEVVGEAEREHGQVTTLLGEAEQRRGE